MAKLSTENPIVPVFYIHYVSSIEKKGTIRFYKAPLYFRRGHFFIFEYFYLQHHRFTNATIHNELVLDF